MRRTIYIALATMAVVLTLVVGCGQIPPTSTPVPPMDTPSPTGTILPPTSTPQPTATSRPAYVPLYELTDCQFAEPPGYEIECGYLTVPENRSQPEGAQIRLHTAIFKSTSLDPKPDPVVHLVGGPGGSLLDDIVLYLRRGGDEILKTRDYIMFNQRGTHYAQPFLQCPGRTELQWELAGEGLPLKERNQREVEFLLDCHDDLRDQGIDLSAYNSSENAADVNDLRIALGYEWINLYGISYGSRLALNVMRAHPQGIRSAIIDAVFPPQANLNQEIAPNVYRALNAVFEDCAADTTCSQAYPDLEATFYRVVDELDADPVSLYLGEGWVVVDGYAFVETFFRLLYSADAIPWIPYLIDQAGQGQYPEVSIFAVPDRSTMGTGMHYSIWCREEMAFESQEQAEALAAELPPVFSELFVDVYDWTVCASWQASVADPIENEAVVSDIPTLVLSGRYDPVTPPAWGRLAAETLANSFVYEFPNVAHGTMRSNSCALEIGLQFLDDPTTEPDTSCLERLGSPEFR
jgi:pimeloyl-ACP methyl ester carboxylesterase